MIFSLKTAFARVYINDKCWGPTPCWKTTATEESFYSSSIRLFPNPTRALIYLESDSPEDLLTAVEITDMSGKVLRQHNRNIRMLDMTSLPAGSYLLILKTEKENLIKQIIKVE